jgi:hypothetical protein
VAGAGVVVQRNGIVTRVSESPVTHRTAGYLVPGLTLW